MKKFTKNMSVIYFLLVISLCAVTFAGPVEWIPPYRGAPNSVYAAFEVDPASGEWLITTFETGPSEFPLADFIPLAVEEPIDNGSIVTVWLPNFIDELPFKLMRIQLSYDQEVFGGSIGLGLEASDPEGAQWNIIGGSGPIMSTEHYFDIEIIPNPDSEIFFVVRYLDDGSIAPSGLNTIEVDTVSAPEPASMALLGLGCLGILRRKH